MADNFERRSYTAGQVIFNEGDPGNEMFLVLQGKVKISRGDSVLGYLTDGGPNGSAPYDGPALRMRPQYEGPHKVSATTSFSAIGRACPSLPRSANVR